MLVLNLIGREDGMSFCDQTVEMLQSTLQVTYLKDKKIILHYLFKQLI